ncbi:glycerophosphoryl diester phosphodiesterase membrane domain-containing protein [Streptomyces sp. NPDC057445]|uniref:glycerophosphoryl diester phosphodiesterase membrane domain-containing protein n=1 Tax=Streptomyces sp. NPDC057445 TaxID=3346136 RepID=UPI0036CEA05E
MNDTPGWASPGSAPSDGQGSGAPRPDEPADAAGPASKWSEQQPPAGRWTPPTAPGGAPVPPARPGWGGPVRDGWGGPPPAAKPGVIPLRPLGVGEILDGAVSTLRAHWRTVLGITITFSVISQIADILIQRYLVPPPPAANPDATPEEAIRQVVESTQSSMIAALPAVAIALIATLFITALLTIVISRSVLGRQVNLSEAWSEARPRLLHLLGLTVLIVLMCAGVIVVGVLPGVLFDSAALRILGGFAGVLVAVWLWVRYALSSPALMLERQSIAQSLRRSAKLVRGAWWRTFGILVLVLVITSIVSMIIAVPFSLLALIADSGGLSGLLSGDNPAFGWPFLIITGIGAVIASSITYPISAGVTVLLYVDQRIRREALDLELARAAGIPGYGPPAPGDDTSRG